MTTPEVIVLPHGNALTADKLWHYQGGQWTSIEPSSIVFTSLNVDPAEPNKLHVHGVIDIGAPKTATLGHVAIDATARPSCQLENTSYTDNSYTPAAHSD